MLKRPRVVLIYPPPWCMAPEGTPQPTGMPFGAPTDDPDPDLSGDAEIMTYGLLTIAAEARRAGYEVRIINAFRMRWPQVEALIAACDAEVFGISAFTVNRRGLAAVARLIREKHPAAHITAGGPFVTALPRETLQHMPEIDSVVIGEGETTFLELLECLGQGRSVAGLAGTGWRDASGPRLGPPRPRIDHLETLASPFDYFTSPIVMTSRGCPSKCTFCGSFTTWGRKLRFLPVETCVELFSRALSRLPLPFLLIKDDTFTADRRRAMAICDAIIERGLHFVWSCDSRVDSVDDALLHKMRLAGCQLISFGVESGSPEILGRIGKRTTPEMVLEATRAARRYGIHVRYYMMMGNRGETPETLQESVELIRAGRPDTYLFSALSLYPGTEEWTLFKAGGQADDSLFFNSDFFELSVLNQRKAAGDHVLLHLQCAVGQPNGFEPTLEERAEVVARIPQHAMAHAELARACYKAGRFDEALQALDAAAALDCPVPFVLDNLRACIALAQGEVDAALRQMEDNAQRHGLPSLTDNLQRLRHWAALPAGLRGAPPRLNDFVLVSLFVDLSPASLLN